jgi:hypothetical protein
MTTKKTRRKAAPFGYHWQAGALVVSPPEAAVRQLAYELYVVEQGRTGVVARLLNERGHLSKTGVPWKDAMVQRILQCPSAQGEFEGHTCDPIISQALWHQYQHIAAQPSRGKAPSHPFASILTCACQAKMRPKGPRYVCVASGCENKIPTEDLEKIFLTELKRRTDLEGLDAVVDQWPTLDHDDRRRIVEAVMSTIEVALDGASLTLTYNV